MYKKMPFWGTYLPFNLSDITKAIPQAIQNL